MKYTVEQARMLKKLSQEDLALGLGISTKAYINKEKGLTRFYIDEALKFCKIVNLEINQILFF